MASKPSSGPTGHGTEAKEPPSEALDRLYAASLDDFVTLRKALAASLRASGDAAASKEVAAHAKPSRTAWALNQVARKQAGLLKSALDARAEAQAAQQDADGDTVRASARAYRERVAQVIQAAAQFAKEDGSQLTPTQGRTMGATLQAIASGNDAALREALLSGRLAADVAEDDPFAGVEFGARSVRVERPAKGAEPHKADTPAPRGRDDLAVRRAAAQAAAAHARAAERDHHTRELEKTRARVVALEAEVKEARALAREAEVAASRAQTEAERARRSVEGIDKRLEEARRALRSFGE